MKRLIAIAAAAAVFGCAGGDAAKKEAGPTEEKQRVANVTYFDVASCFPAKLTVPEAVTQEVLLGVLVAARPQVMECMVPPTARGEAETTNVTAKATTTVSGSEVQLTAENLTAEGEACVKAALTKATEGLKLKKPEAPEPAPVKKGKKAPPPPPPPADPEPVSAEAKFTHVRDLVPSVTMGLNQLSDVMGAIRLGLPQWCDCFTAWEKAVPQDLTAELTLAHGAKPKDAAADAKDPSTVRATSVTFAPGADPAANQVASCLQQKIASTDFTNPASQELKLPKVPFHFIHSGIQEPLSPATESYYRFVHMDALRGQATAAAAVTLGARMNAVVEYDNLVKRYKADPQKEWRLVPTLRTKCQELIKADDAWIESLDRVLTVSQQTVTLTTELKTADAAWTEADTAAQAQVAESEKDLNQAKAFRQQDQGACPK